MPGAGNRIMGLSGRRGLVLATAILLIATALSGFSYISRKKPAVAMQIIVDDKVMEVLDLSRDTELTVTDTNRGINYLIVRDGEIWYSEAGCPDKVCVHQDKKHLSSNTIVCLSDKMIVTITGDE